MDVRRKVSLKCFKNIKFISRLRLFWITIVVTYPLMFLLFGENQGVSQLTAGFVEQKSYNVVVTVLCAEKLGQKCKNPTFKWTSLKQQPWKITEIKQKKNSPNLHPWPPWSNWWRIAASSGTISFRGRVPQPSSSAVASTITYTNLNYLRSGNRLCFTPQTNQKKTKTTPHQYTPNRIVPILNP